MIKEPKNIDFYTSGRQPSKEDFKRISEWILKRKEKQKHSKKSIKKKSEKQNVFEIKN
jgi:Zn-dependent M16 (insulinase) family peptidase